MSTLTLYKAFKAMGAPDEAAEQAAAAVDEYLASDLSRLETKIDRLDAGMDKLDSKGEVRFGKTDEVLYGLKSDVKLLKWMITFIGGLCVLILGKLFI